MDKNAKVYGSDKYNFMDLQINLHSDNTSSPQQVDQFELNATDDQGFEQVLEINHSSNTSVPNIAQIPLAPATSLPHHMTTSMLDEANLYDKTQIMSDTLEVHKNLSVNEGSNVTDSFEAAQPNFSVTNTTNLDTEQVLDKSIGLSAPPIELERSSQSTSPEVAALTQPVPDVSPAAVLPIQSQGNMVQPSIEQRFSEGLGNSINNYPSGVEGDNLTESNLGDTLSPDALAYQQGVVNSQHFNDLESVSGVSESVSMTNLPALSQNTTSVDTAPSMDNVATSAEVTNLPTKSQLDTIALSDLSDISDVNGGVGAKSIPNIAPTINPNNEPVDLFESINSNSLQPPTDTLNISTQVTDDLRANTQPLQFIQPTNPTTALSPALSPPPTYDNRPTGSPAPQNGPIQGSVLAAPTPSPKPKTLLIRNVLIVFVVVMILVIAGLVAKSVFFSQALNTKQEPTKAEAVDVDQQNAQQDSSSMSDKTKKPIKDTESTQSVKSVK